MLHLRPSRFPPWATPVAYMCAYLLTSWCAFQAVTKHLRYVSTVTLYQPRLLRPQPTADSKLWAAGMVIALSSFCFGMLGYYRFRRGDKYRKTFMVACCVIQVFTITNMYEDSFSVFVTMLELGIWFGQLLCTIMNVMWLYPGTGRRRSGAGLPVSNDDVLDVEMRAFVRPGRARADTAAARKRDDDDLYRPRRKDRSSHVVFFAVNVVLCAVNWWLMDAWRTERNRFIIALPSLAIPLNLPLPPEQSPTANWMMKYIS